MQTITYRVKMQTITYREIKVGDIVCVDPDHGVERIAKIEDHGDKVAFLDSYDNGTLISKENLDWTVQIIPREFLDYEVT